MTVPLPMVKTETLKKVVAYCKHHLNNPPEEIPAPLPTSNLAEVRASVAQAGRAADCDASSLRCLDL